MVGLEAIEWVIFLCPRVLSATIHVSSASTTKSSSLPPAAVKTLLLSSSTLLRSSTTLLRSSSKLLRSPSRPLRSPSTLLLLLSPSTLLLLLSPSSFPHISLASLGHPLRQSAICRKFPFATPLAFLSAQSFAQSKTAYIAHVIQATM